MNSKSREIFTIGDRVVVMKNSERIPEYAKIGEHGTVIGYACDDCKIEFDDGSIVYIWYIDLEKE